MLPPMLARHRPVASDPLARIVDGIVAGLELAGVALARLGMVEAAHRWQVQNDPDELTPVGAAKNTTTEEVKVS